MIIKWLLIINILLFVGNVHYKLVMKKESEVLVELNGLAMAIMCKLFVFKMLLIAFERGIL